MKSWSLLVLLQKDKILTLGDLSYAQIVTRKWELETAGEKRLFRIQRNSFETLPQIVCIAESLHVLFLHVVKKYFITIFYIVK